MRRLFTMTIVLAVACAGLIAPSGAAALSADASAKPQPTGFALLAVGFGSRVEGGQLPAGSDATAYEVIGCTQMSGKMRKNYEAEVEVPGLGLLEGVTTKLWTEKKGGTVSSYSSHSIARVTIGARLLVRSDRHQGRRVPRPRLPRREGYQGRAHDKIATRRPPAGRRSVTADRHPRSR